MNDEVIDFVLDGLERALELERELGVRTIEIDRSLLAPKAENAERKPGVVAQKPPVAARKPEAARQSPVGAGKPVSKLVFLHDRPLSEGGVAMMAKIIVAMGRTAENAPIVVAPPAPVAKIVVVLGGRAMKKYYPEIHGEPGQWYKAEDGTDILITYSPEYLLRFGTVTPAVEKLKREMWRSLKSVMQRLAVLEGNRK